MTERKALELTEVESTLRKLLLDTAAYIDETAQDSTTSTLQLNEELKNAKLELRFTGGWVRDKLLGVGSYDIDIAINKMTGEQFGLKMQEYLNVPGNADKYKNVGDVGLHKIEANPEKSKHLETITTKIFGLDIDLVNLRKETYTEDSRNPQIEFGTPEEDALRRDATVNAMFYNLGTSTIEDFTGRGFEDMKLKIIRTPMDPYQTFKDDPLRVLRLIRFASRLGYVIDPDAEKAMSNPEIKADFQVKITRERVGVEFDKMLRGPDPRQAIALIDRLGLYETVFHDPQNDHDFSPEVAHLPIAYNLVARLLEPAESSSVLLFGIRSWLIHNAEEQHISWLLSSLIPYADAPPTKNAKGKQQTLAQVIAREGIKAPNKACDVIAASILNFDQIRQLKDKFISQSKSPNKRVEGDDATARDTLGMAIRKWGVSWRHQTLFALLHEVANNPDSETSIVSSYFGFLEHISDQGLMEAYDFKPLLDGTTLVKALDARPGQWMKEALDVVMAWQLVNPQVTDPAVAIEALKPDLEKRATAPAETTKRELPSRLAHHFLSTTLRPIFAQSKEQKKHAAATETGHRNTRDLPPPKMSMSAMLDDDESKLWKGKASWAIDLFRWSVAVLDKKGVESNWPLLLPPIMTLLDDIKIEWKTKGVSLLNLLLERTTPELLARTGLGDIFETELFPLFTYLPSLTPEEDSIKLLNTTYPALLTLVQTRYPCRIKSKPSPENAKKQEKFLDAIVRKGVLTPFVHAGEHARIAETLLSNLVPILEGQGISSVKNFKDIIPLLAAILSEPLGHAYPPLLVRAAVALQAVIRNGKPRMAFHFGGVLKGPTVCWIRLEDHGGDFDEVKKELVKAVQMLKDAVGDEVDVTADVSKLIDADPRLRPLLQPENHAPNT